MQPRIPTDISYRKVIGQWYLNHLVHRDQEAAAHSQEKLATPSSSPSVFFLKVGDWIAGSVIKSTCPC